MQLTASNQHTHLTAAKLFVCTESAQLEDLTAQVLCQHLEDNTFSATQIPHEGKLNHIAVLRLTALDTATLQKNAREAATWAQQHHTISVELTPFCDQDAPRVCAALIAAFGEATYRFNRFKSDPKPAKIESVEFVHYKHSDLIAHTISEAQALLYGVNLCKDLANTASNVCTPTYLAETAAAEAQKFGATAKILGRDFIRENMPSFWGVAKGSVQEPKLLELSYQGASSDEAPIVLVGKGLTFDSGGISLKPGEGMDEMKYDMCGAASVIGAFIAAVQSKLPINLKVVVATCENMPDGGAAKPGDVVRAMNGTTIENLNTDAEGRLVLCDALTYTEQFKPRAVIDVATLTGACIIALGHVASGLTANDQNLADALLEASRQTNDKAWQLPLFDEYKEQLKSNFADLQNIGGRPAGTITAATFLAHFAQNYTWAHLDIAGTAWKSGKEKGATGRPVALLLQYLKNAALN